MQEAVGARTPRSTSPLDTVPFYQIIIVTPGQAKEVTVTAPNTLSTYVVRAFAASSDGQTFGAAETEFTVRRPLSLTPSVPRLLRAGDSGSVGVIVTFFGKASQAAPAAVEVSVEASGLKLTGPVRQQIEFAASGTQQEVRFPVSAQAVGDGKLVFTAMNAAANDSLAVELETLVPQPPVVVSSTFAVAHGQGWKAL
jgi:alpha-2-macroglobulin